ncbi:MAG: hypothetical protein J0M19_06390 [Sphingomonadales bacterium]|nr:hypothetical protein [Sphingomonadales bacterium]
MKRLALRNMLSGGALSAVRLVMGVAKIKLIALWLGVEGVGHFSLLTQVAVTGTALVSMSLAIPLINLGRPNIAAEDYRAAGSAAGTVAAVLAINALLITLVWVIGGSWLLSALGAELRPEALRWPILLAILFGAIAGGFWEGMSFLIDRFDTYVRANILSAVLDAVAIGGAAWAFGIEGAILALPVAPLTLLIGYVVQIAPNRVARSVLAAMRPQWAQLRPIFAYCALMVGTISATNIVQTWLRSQVLTLSGSAANGYLQVATALSSYLLSFVMTGFWGHLHARAAAEGDTAGVRSELRKSIRLGMGISFAGCVAAILLAPFIITLFYATSFAQATQLLRPYLVGEFAFQVFSMIVAYQLTIGRRRRYAVLNAVYIAALAIGGTVLIPQLGSSGYVLAHIAAASLAGIAGLWVALRHRQLTWEHAGMLAALWVLIGGLSWLLGGFNFVA